MPAAALLSQYTGVGVCGLISSRIKRIILVSLPFINKAPDLASAAETAMNVSIQHTMYKYVTIQ